MHRSLDDRVAFRVERDGQDRGPVARMARPATRVGSFHLRVELVASGQDRSIVSGVTLSRAHVADAAMTMIVVAYSGVMHCSGSCTVETHVPAGRVKRASPLCMIWSRSECVQESQDPISRSESHSVRAKGRQLLQGAFLCG